MSKRLYLVLGILLIITLLALMFYGLFWASDPRKIPSSQVGKTAKQFETTTFDGQKISLSQFQGKPVVLNFWASWCVSCRQEARLLEAIHKKYTPKGAVVIGIAINDTREASLASIRRYGKTYYLAPDDKTGTIALDYGVTAVPETFLINKQGIIKDKVLGAVNWKTLESFMKEQLP